MHGSDPAGLLTERLPYKVFRLAFLAMQSRGLDERWPEGEQGAPT